MAFTPAAGLMMGTRSGDIDPGLLVYLMRTKKLTPESMDDLISRRCGLTGVSGGSSMSVRCRKTGRPMRGPRTL